MKNLRQPMFIVLLCFFSLFSFAQKNGLVNLKLFQGNNVDAHISIIKIPDGYLTVGKSSSTAATLPGAHGGEDGLVIKYDTAFNIIWKKAFGGAGNDRLLNAISSPDGSYLLSGYTESEDGDVQRPAGRGRDAWVLKVDTNGTLLWQKAFGGTRLDYASSCIRAYDNTYLLMCNTASIDGDIQGKDSTDNDVWLLRMDESGTILEQRFYGGSDYEGSLIYPDHFISDKTSLIKTMDGGYAFISTTKSNSGQVSGNHGDRDLWIVKLNATLNLQWQKCIGGTAEDAGYGLHQLSDSSFIASGYAYSNSGDIPGVYNGSNRSSVVARLTAQGEKLWVRTFGEGIFYNATSEPNGDFTIVGFGYLNQSINYGYQIGKATMLKMNKEGQVLWYRHVGGDEYDYLFDVVTGSNNTFIAVGSANSRTGDLSGYNTWYDALLVQVKELSSLKGLLFYDLNNNGIKDANETYPYNIGFRSRHKYGPNPYLDWNVTFLNPPYDNFKDGRFIISQDTGTYTLSWSQYDTAAYVFVPQNSYAYRFTAPRQQDTITVRLVPKSIIRDISTTISGPTSTDLNNNITYQVLLTNKGGDSVTNGRLKVVKDARTDFTIPSSANDTLTISLATIAGFTRDTVHITVHTSSTEATVGDTLKLQAWVELDHDFDTSNNYAVSKTLIAGMYIHPDTTKPTLQPPMGLQWVRFMNGNGSDYARSVAALPDGGFVIAGNTFSKSGDFAMSVDSFGNAFVSQFDKDGVNRWTKVFKGSGNDIFHSIKYGEDGSFLVAGESASTDGDFTNNSPSQNIAVFKLNADGSIRWKKYIGAGGTDYFYNMHPTLDKGVLVTHSIYTTSMGNQNYLTKLDSLGVVQWSTSVDSTMQRFDAAPAPGNKYVAVGLHTVSTFGDAYRVLKFNNYGGTEWQKTFRLSETAPTYFYFVNQVHVDKDSSIYLLGDIQYLAADSVSGTNIGLHKDIDFALVKLDKNGNKLWQRFYGGNSKEYPFSFTPTEDGGFLITGYTYSGDGNVSALKGLQDGWLLKVDAEGKLLWQRTIGGNRADELFDVTVTKDNGIVAVGYTGSNNSGDIYKNTGDIDVLIAKIGSSNNIQGTVYFDANSNSAKDADERYLNNIMVKSIKGENERMDITKNSFFSISVDTGMYRTQPIISENFKVNPLVDTVRFTTYNNIDTVHFAVQPKEIKKDLQISLLPLTPVRPGFEAVYKLAVRNAGTITMSLDTVILVKDRRQTLINATPAYTFIKNDTITWIINKLEPLDAATTIYITLRNAVPPSLNNGDRIELVATIAPTADDATPLNNIAGLAQTVQGSYDPNDKTELHNGRITQRQLTDKEYLTYLIRFQNTGTDTAFRVIIRDTLEKKLDWTTFDMLEASHPYSLSITDKNKLEWTFNNINLPDSNVNEKRSHGYISYRLKPIDGLKVGDSIINTAFIYFDFNLPVVTNRSNTTVSVETVTSVSEPDPNEKNIQLFPNPTKDVLWININERITDKVGLAIYDLSGKKLWQKQYGKITAEQFTEQLNFKHYSKGVYMVNLSIGAKSYSYKVVVE